MRYLINQFRDWLIKQESERESYTKESFWASEGSDCLRSMYWKWIGEDYTNKSSVEGLQIMGVGKRVEEQIVDDWTKMGIVVPPPEGEEQHRIDMERMGVKITGKLDAIIKEVTNDGKKIETPVEIKTFYGDYQERLLLKLQPNENYLKQLAIYMDALNKDRGILYMVNRGNGKQFQFIVTRGDKKYRLNGISYYDSEGKLLKQFNLGKMEIDVDDIYKRFAEAHEYIKKDKMPPCSFKYKYPITKESLKLQTYSSLSAARMGRAVIGDWQCKYCGYKDKCIKEQGIGLGYTKEEKEKIMELTKGYTTKQWRE